MFFSVLLSDCTGVCLNIPEILGWIKSAMDSLGITPFVYVILLVMAVISIWALVARARQ